MTAHKGYKYEEKRGVCTGRLAKMYHKRERLQNNTFRALQYNAPDYKCFNNSATSADVQRTVVPNFSEIERSAAELLRLKHVQSGSVRHS